MNTLSLTVEVAPGLDIADACRDTVALAKKLEIAVWFEFNGVRCLADKNTDADRLALAWETVLGSSFRHKFASDPGRA